MSELHIQNRIVRDGVISLQDLITSQNLDDKMSKVIDEIEGGTYTGVQYVLQKSVLMRKAADGKLKICLPNSLLKHIFVSQHCTTLGFHRSASQIAMTLGADYYAPNMMQTMKKFALECHYCLLNRPNTAPKHTYHSTLNALAPRQLWSFDICSGMNKTARDKDKIYVFVDNYSLFSILVATDSKSATSIVDAIKKHIVTPFCAPQAIRSDQERGLVHSQAARDFADSHGIQLIPTAAGCPFSNAVAEGRIKLIRSQIRSMAAALHDRNWDESLDLLCCSINQTVGRNGLSPEQIQFGFTNCRINDPLQIQTTPLSDIEHVAKIQATLKSLFDRVEKQRALSRMQNEKFANSTRVERSFILGQVVLVQNDIIQTESGMVSKWRGPYVIVKISEHSQTCTVVEEATTKTIKAHFSKMKPVREVNSLPRLNSNWDESLKRAFD